MRILVTGASGFVGEALCACLQERGHSVRAAIRSVSPTLSSYDLEIISVGNISGQTDWSPALVGVDCVIHCAGRAHVMRETETSSAAYRTINVAATRRLAEQAAASGVRRLVFLSSIKANGWRALQGAPSRNGEFLAGGFEPTGYVRSFQPHSSDPYGQSKWEAEQVLWEISAERGLQVVVIRPPLVYGPKVKGNLLRLLRWVARGLWLPLGAVHNRRSMVGLSNLVDLLALSIGHPLAAGGTFAASDGCDLSTPRLIQLLAQGLDKPVRLLPVPVELLRLGGALLGKRDEIDRLVGSLQVDSKDTQQRLGWYPPVTVEDGVLQMADWYAKREVDRA